MTTGTVLVVKEGEVPALRVLRAAIGLAMLVPGVAACSVESGDATGSNSEVSAPERRIPPGWENPLVEDAPEAEPPPRPRRQTSAPAREPTPVAARWSPGHPLTIRYRQQRLDTVVALQQRLDDLGYGPLAADGHFGPQTESAVRQFQADEAIAVDGLVGEETWNRLFRIVLSHWSPEGWTPVVPAWFSRSQDPAQADTSDAIPGIVPGTPSAICGDGTLSYSTSRSGTCSWHGGVDTWYP
ncbi:hypothetical protein GCM10027273_11210 [Nocardioides pakistanensis]